MSPKRWLESYQVFFSIVKKVCHLHSLLYSVPFNHIINESNQYVHMYPYAQLSSFLLFNSVSSWSIFYPFSDKRCILFSKHSISVLFIEKKKIILTQDRFSDFGVFLCKTMYYLHIINFRVFVIWEYITDICKMYEHLNLLCAKNDWKLIF